MPQRDMYGGSHRRLPATEVARNCDSCAREVLDSKGLPRSQPSSRKCDVRSAKLTCPSCARRATSPAECGCCASLGRRLIGSLDRRLRVDEDRGDEEHRDADEALTDE